MMLDPKPGIGLERFYDENYLDALTVSLNWIEKHFLWYSLYMIWSKLNVTTIWRLIYAQLYQTGFIFSQMEDSLL